MTKERFEELAAIYGADIGRWPAELLDEASLLLAAEPGFARAVLAREGALDEVLDALPRPLASAALFERVVASAPAARRRPDGWRGWLLPAGLGATLAAATAAGVLLGAQLSAQTGLGNDTAAQAVADLDVTGLSEDV